ncbi:bacterial bifunctional deaminase-reductase [Guyanagaster necrorhizus]|uniref:2,5-diamino-6-ribosylamino-4(3H)-pyrimidinone 5'-phosphate reductase n=1 Tax=Guyanagaster necrorhizus TaxID=856835 RepID=A0A9P7VU88_9AGAR|nr:bacterial bifunctional deaminase-reductase [Guyanagaster necrorhizus MCA 3950]KAG7447493.1 bacterial bifunctional deaminase-reductase [Guyanagaster necrorhizus MCA 3950]
MDLGPPQFLTSILNRCIPRTLSAVRPNVTLTFAQSLDAKISGQDGAQLILSGKESMVMTHWMRTMHDAILVGIGTAVNDNPQLNARHLPPRSPLSGQDYPYNLPRPIVLDSQLRLPTTCKLLESYRNEKGRRPWVLCAQEPQAEEDVWKSRLDALEAAGARVVPVQTTEGLLSIPSVLQTLHELGVRSLMVEGGARVIGSFLAERDSVDTVIITIAPKFVGSEGVGYGVDISQVSYYEHLESQDVGCDTVVALNARSD